MKHLCVRLVLLGVLVAGCAGGPTQEEVAAVAAAGALTREIILLPLNVVMTLPVELEDVSEQAIGLPNIEPPSRSRPVRTNRSPSPFARIKRPRSAPVSLIEESTT